MAVYAIGDIQGCCDELEALIAQLNYDPISDELWLVGDLVNRGPDSLATLRLVKSLGSGAITILGNHDLHLLALSAARKTGAATPVVDTWLQPVLDAPDTAALLDWLRQKPLAHYSAELNTLMVHAGVPAEWSLGETLDHAAEVQGELTGENGDAFLAAMYGSKPTRWSAELSGIDRLRFITNALTRIRYSTRDGTLDFAEKLAPGTQPEHLLPWFELPDRSCADTRIVFGHWSTLGFLARDNVVALDTGCVWGGRLTAFRLDEPADPVTVASGQTPRYG